jgi:hypothetical protein
LKLDHKESFITFFDTHHIVKSQILAASFLYHNIPTHADNKETQKSTGLVHNTFEATSCVAVAVSALELSHQNSLSSVHPKTLFKKCIVHKKRNLLNKVKSEDKEELAKDLKTVFNTENYNDTKEGAIKKKY